jgi:kanamycin kinase
VTESDVAVPAPVVAAAGGREVSLVWANDAGGLTFAVGEGEGRRFIKWAPADSGVDLSAEGRRLAWARRYHPVPQPLDCGHDSVGSWLVTAAVPGDNAVSARWKSDPGTAVTAIGEGLRALHEALPTASCPFSRNAKQRLNDARQQAATDRLDPATWHPCHQGLTVTTALQYAAAIPPPDKLVVCHGDACAPNTLLNEGGRWAGHVDLGLLGIADRWADLAVATWSAEWNYGPGWDGLLLDAYGIRPDPERTRYYRLLYDLSS